MRSLYVPGKARICLVTYQDEKDLPEGQKLKRCSRCNEAYYISREAQMEHWPLHKKVCCPVEKDHPALRDGNHAVALHLNTIEGCAETVGSLIKSFRNANVMRWPRLLTFALQRLKDLFSEDPQNLVPSSGDTGESMLWNLIIYCREISSDGLDYLFAIPGFANYFLSDDLFLSKEMAIRKENGLCPLTGAKLDEEGKAAMKRNEYEYSSFQDYEDIKEAERKYPGTYTAPLYCTAMFQLISAFAYSIKLNKLNKPDLLSALFRRVFRTWACPYGRISFPDIRNITTSIWDRWKCRNTLVLWFLCHSPLPDVGQSGYNSQGNGCIPGITDFQLFTRILDDNVSFNCAGAVGRDCSLPTFLRLLRYREDHDGDTTFIDLNTDERILLLNRLVTEDVVGVVSSRDGHDFTTRDMLLNLLMGWCRCKVLIQIYHRMNEQLSKNDKFVDDKTKGLIHTIWMNCQISIMRSLFAYVDVVETQRQRKQDAGSQSGLSKPFEFPEDVSALIREFSFPKKFPLQINRINCLY